MAGTLYVPPDTYYSFGPSLRQKVVPPTERGGGRGGADTVQAKAKTILSVLPQETHGKLIKHFGFMSLGWINDFWRRLWMEVSSNKELEIIGKFYLCYTQLRSHQLLLV